MDDEQHEFIRAHVDCGDLRWESKLVGNPRVARMQHDEDVSDYTDQDIRDLTVQMLDVSDEQVGLIEVIYE